MYKFTLLKGDNHMSNIKRIISFVLALVLACGALAGVELPRAEAAQTYNLAQLLSAGTIKPLGRAMVADGKVLTVWSGTGYEMNVFVPAETTLTVGYESTYSCYWAVLVDGEQVARVSVARGTGTFNATIPYGNHTVSVVQETQICNSSFTEICFLTTMSMGATLQAAPAEKDLYIEFIGDSYSCGSGTLVDYKTGVKDFSDNGHSATHGFPWYTAKALNADYSIVARGGIGMFVAASAQEGTPNSKSITDIYKYNAGYNTAYGEYSGGAADIVVIYIGANDTINSANTIDAWKTKVAKLVTLAQQKNPGASVVCMSSDDSKYHAMKALADSESYENVYAFFCGHHGNGGAALNWQTEGHPSAADSEQLAKELANFIRYNNLILQQEQTQQTPAYNDIFYYVSENGNNNNDGLSPEAAKLTLGSALGHAEANQTFERNDRLVIRISGRVLGADGQALGAELTNSAGEPVPVLVTTNPDQNNKAILQVMFTAATTSGQCSLAVKNNLTLQNLQLQSVANANGLAPYNIYAAGYSLTFDNVEFTNDGQATKVENWNVGCVNFMDGNNILEARTKPMYGTVTFLNGDYTNLGIVAGVHPTSIWTQNGNVYALPYYHSRLVIGEGAKMGTIYGRYSTMQLGSITVEINGGEVASYIGTNSGSSTTIRDHYGYENGSPEVETDLNLVINGGKVQSIAITGNYVKMKGNVTTTINAGTFGTYKGTGDKVTLDGNVVNNIVGGVFHGFMGTGNSANITGNVELNMTGGRIEVQHSSVDHSVYLSGDGVVNGNVTNTISGGEIHVYTNANVDTLIIFGGKDLTVRGTLTNKISGGSFAIFKGTSFAKTRQMYFGALYSPGTTLLRNELTGGNFYIYTASDSVVGFYVGGRGVKSVFGKIENVLGVKDQPSKAPRFQKVPLYLAGNWGQLGVSYQVTTSANAPTTNSDTAVLSNTIYGGYYESFVYAGHNGETSGSNFSFIKGSIENNIYDGYFIGTYFGAPAKGEVFGKVTNNIYGGRFADFYGAGDKVKIYDGLEINIYGMEDFQLCANNKSTTPTNYVFDIGNRGAGAITASTAGRPAIKLVIDGKKPEDVAIYKTMTLTATEASATPVVEIKSGTFPTSLKLTGSTVEDVLSNSSVCFVGEQKVTPDAGATSVAGAVTVKTVPAMIGNTIYESVEEALKNADGSQPVQLGKDAAVNLLRINATKKLDINGNTLTAADILSFGHFIDSSNGKGLLKMSNDSGEAALLLRQDNAQLPVYDVAAGGYRFYNRETGKADVRDVDEVTKKFRFQLVLPTAEAYELLQNAQACGVSVEVTVKVGNRLTLSYVYGPEHVEAYAAGMAAHKNDPTKSEKALTITLSGMNAVKAGETVTVIPRVVTDAGVVMQLASLTWTPAAQ